MREYFGAVNGMSAEGLRLPQPTIAEALSQVESASPVNLAWLIPAGTLRHQVMGPRDRKPEPAEISEMQSLVAAGMADGAVGLSTGLDYLPGRYADTAEIAALCEPIAEVGGVYVSHMRGYDVAAWQGMAEVCAIAERARVPVHVSHYFGPGIMLARLIDDARNAGVDVTFDSYPYLRGATILTMAALPPEVQDGGVAETLSRLKDQAVRKRLKEQWFPAIADRLHGIRLSFVADGGLAWAEGMSLEDAAAQAGLDLGDFVCDLLVRSDLAVGCVRAETSGYCCAMKRRWAAQTGFSSGLCLTPGAGARSRGSWDVTYGSSATGRGRRLACTSPGTQPAGSGCGTGASSGTGTLPTSRWLTRLSWRTRRPMPSRGGLPSAFPMSLWEAGSCSGTESLPAPGPAGDCGA